MSAQSGILAAATPAAWYDAAVIRWRELIVDHATCEKKAASTALSLMFAYSDDVELGRALSRLAREELRHYEQVLTKMAALGVAYDRRAPSRYAGGLRRAVCDREPGRRLDLLLCGALIEARSAERFAGLVPRLEPVLAEFYAGLHAAEARHQSLYLDLAGRYAVREGLDGAARLRALAAVEADLATSPDEGFHFHSGSPSTGVSAVR